MKRRKLGDKSLLTDEQAQVGMGDTRGVQKVRQSRRDGGELLASGRAAFLQSVRADRGVEDAKSE